MPYIRSLIEHLYQYLFIYYFVVPQCLLSNIMLLSLYRSLPYCGVYSRCAASAVLNSDSGGGYAAISRCLNKE